MPLSTSDKIDKAIADVVSEPYHKLPRAVVMVATKDQILYSGAGGYATLPPFPASEEAIQSAPKVTDESIFELWSCTKLVAVIAALQLVERGELKVEDDASQYVKELKNIKVLAGFDKEDEPILEDNTVPITVEMLICHTAGGSYDNHPDFTKYAAKSKVNKGFYAPGFDRKALSEVAFLNKPGAHWQYGPANDWLTLVVEEVTGKKLQDYFQENIFDPLHIVNTQFARNPDTIDIAHASTTPGGPHTFAPSTQFDSSQDLGGAGLSGSPKSYLAIVQTLLNGGESPVTGNRILKQETVDLMFQPHLHSEQQKQDLSEWTKNMIEPWSFNKGNPKAFPNANWGYGGFLSGSDIPSGRKTGSLAWSGLANTFWVIDRTTGICFIIFSNILPSRPLPLWPFWEQVESAIYEAVKENGANHST